MLKVTPLGLPDEMHWKQGIQIQLNLFVGPL